MDISFPELLIVLVVVVLLFGPGRIAAAMGELGKGLNAFKEGFSSKDEEIPEPTATEIKNKS